MEEIQQLRYFLDYTKDLKFKDKSSVDALTQTIEKCRAILATFTANNPSYNSSQDDGDLVRDIKETTQHGKAKDAFNYAKKEFLYDLFKIIGHLSDHTK
ncbi:hypothetical protein ACFQ3S_01800 [Mucilaginibacter terrae]|uniref:hypothetical protein n=1 Tax=Mucilaginibacter terrae TaxID=1955052 RepID=UPI00363939A0